MSRHPRLATAFAVALGAVLITSSVVTAAPSKSAAAPAPSAPAPLASPPKSSSAIKNVIPITRVLAYGQKVTAVAIEYKRDVSPKTLDRDTFTVSDSLYNFRFDPIEDLVDPDKRGDRTVTAVYTNDTASLEADRKSDKGRFVIVELGPRDQGGSTVMAWQGGVKVNTDLQTKIVQNEAVYGISGKNGLGPMISRASKTKIAPTKPAINLLVDDFKYERFTGSTGTVLPYAYHLPKGYNAAKKYPVVVVLPGHGMGYRTDASGASNEGVQVAADIPATAWLQKSWTGTDEGVIVLAPQNPRIGSPDDQAALMVEQLNAFTKKYSVNPDRIYASTVSYGSTLAWSALQKQPGLFDGALITGGFGASEAQAAAIASSATPVWITHGTGDHLLNVVTTGQASFNRIWNAYISQGKTPAQASKLVKYTEYPLAAFYEPDQHLAAAPTYEDPSILQWLLAQ